MSKTGRPKVFDEKKRELLCGLIGIGFTRRQAAQHVGVSRRTVARAIQEDEEFGRHLHNAELNQELRPIQHIATQMPKNWRAAAWMLERQRPDLYVRRTPRTVTLGDLRGIFGALMKLLLDGVPQQEARDRVQKNVEAFLRQLGGRQRCSPRVRRVLDNLEHEGSLSSPASVADDQPTANCGQPEAVGAPPSSGTTSGTQGAPNVDKR
jgi:hypothetical protein